MTARKLSVLDDPLPEALLIQFLGIDEASLGQATDELVAARFLLTQVGGRPWFHERKRAFVRTKLSPAELDSAATRAAETVFSALLETDAGEPLFVSAFARLAEDARSLRHEDLQLDAAISADDAGLAVLAALVELETPGDRGAAEADQVLRHARRFTDAPLDPVATFASLESAGLVVTASNDYATALVPMLTGKAIAYVVGAAYMRLRRRPVPQLSMLALHTALKPTLGNFASARFGMGRPSLGGLARTAGGSSPEPMLGMTKPDRDNPGCHTLARGAYANRPIWLIATYDDPDERDRAASVVRSVDTELIGERLIVNDVFAHPLEVVPDQRFVNAASRLLLPVSTVHIRETGDIRLPLEQPIDLDSYYELRVETAKLVSRLASKTERFAIELDEPFSLYWDEAQRSRIECTVYGEAEKAVRVPGLARIDAGSRYTFFQLEQELALGELASLQNVNRHWGKAPIVDPLFAELARRRQRAQVFNSAQPRLGVTLGQRTLVDLVTGGYKRLMSDARALSELALMEAQPLPPTALYAYVLLSRPHRVGCPPRVKGYRSRDRCTRRR